MSKKENIGRLWIICSLFFLIAVFTYATEPISSDIFVRAIENDSSAPNYVLITVVNDKTKETRQICTLATFLLGAIHREHQISYEETGIRKVKELALTQEDRTFHFSRTDALKNIQPRYNDKILSEMRTTLKGFSIEEIRRGFKGDGKKLDKLYMDRPDEQYSAYRDAIAFILLERGLLPRQGCVAGYLTIDD